MVQKKKKKAANLQEKSKHILFFKHSHCLCICKILFCLSDSISCTYFNFINRHLCCFVWLFNNVLTWKYMVSMETVQETFKVQANIWLIQKNKYNFLCDHWLSQKHLKEYSAVKSMTMWVKHGSDTFYSNALCDKQVQVHMRLLIIGKYHVCCFFNSWNNVYLAANCAKLAEFWQLASCGHEVIWINIKLSWSWDLFSVSCFIMKVHSPFVMCFFTFCFCLFSHLFYVTCVSIFNELLVNLVSVFSIFIFYHPILITSLYVLCV